MEKQKVLFLCTGNSARSQMAEGLVNHLLGDEWQAMSAGTRPAGYVHPLAVRAMAELEIDISHQYSKSADLYRDVAFDRVITLCDDAAKNCPAWLGAGRVQHIGFPDPAAVEGDEALCLAAFRRVRDEIRARVFAALQQEPGGVEVFLHGEGSI